MWHLWAPPYPTFGYNSTACCRKGLSTRYRRCLTLSGILTKIPQQQLCYVGRSCQTLSHWEFPSAWVRNIPCTGALVFPNPPLLHPQPPAWWKRPPMKCTLRESGLYSVIRLLFPSYSKFLIAFLNAGYGVNTLCEDSDHCRLSVFTFTFQRENLYTHVCKTSHLWCSKSGIQLQLFFIFMDSRSWKQDLLLGGNSCETSQNPDIKPYDCAA